MKNSEKSSGNLTVSKPESLEAKFKMMTLAPLDRRMKRKHLAVYGFILDWFHSKYGDALASVRHIVEMLKERDIDGKGLYAGDVHSALQDLVAWGYLDVEVGAGRLASRYTPVWNFRSVRETPNTNDDERSVLVSPNAGVLDSPNATGASVSTSPNEDPSYMTRSLDPGTCNDGDDSCAAPMAPPLAGLSATTAGTAQGEFEELWAEYDYKHKKREARAEYKRLAPDADLHARMMAAAREWRHAAVLRTDASAPRKFLHTWIRDEEYECSPPVAFKPKERAPKGKPAPANSNRQTVPRTMEVFKADIAPDGSVATLVFQDLETGEMIERAIELYKEIDLAFEKKQAGHDEFDQLVRALGIDLPEDIEDLECHQVMVTVQPSGKFRYDPAPFVPDEPPAPDPMGTIIDKDWRPPDRGGRTGPLLPGSLADMFANTPLQGWSRKIGTAYDDDDEDAA